MNKKVTVIIPVFNAAKYLTECLDSIFVQTYKNIEVIAVDNESVDNSLQILKTYAEISPLIIDTAPNLYLGSWSEPVERALELATGDHNDYFTIIGADDKINLKYLESCVNIASVLFNERDCLAFFSDFDEINDNGDIIVTGVQRNIRYRSLKQFKQLCMQYCPVKTPTVFYSMGLYRSDLFTWRPEKYAGASDYDYFCQLANIGTMIKPVPLKLGYQYRWHSQQATWEMKKAGVNYDKMIQDYWRKRWNKNGI